MLAQLSVPLAQALDGATRREDVRLAGELAIRIKKGIKESGAWRYPGGVIQRHADRVINGKEYFDPKDPSENRRRHESNFFITLSTNKQLTGAPLAAGKEAMRKTLNYLKEDKALCAYLKFGPKHFEVYGKDVYARTSSRRSSDIRHRKEGD